MEDAPSQDPFDGFLRAAEKARSRPAYFWDDYGRIYEAPLAAEWARQLEEPPYEDGSVISDLASATYYLGWQDALRRVAILLGIDAAMFLEVVDIYGQVPRDDIPMSLLQAMRRGEKIDTRFLDRGAAIWPADEAP